VGTPPRPSPEDFGAPLAAQRAIAFCQIPQQIVSVAPPPLLGAAEAVAADSVP